MEMWPDYEQLISDLQGNDESRTIEVVVLKSDSSGIEQVSEILSDRSGLSAVHFITHGADGMISLGSSWLTNANLPQHGEAIAKWVKPSPSRETFFSTAATLRLRKTAKSAEQHLRPHRRRRGGIEGCHRL